MRRLALELPEQDPGEIGAGGIAVAADPVSSRQQARPAPVPGVKCHHWAGVGPRSLA